MSEDLIWDILDNQFCSFKAKFEKLKLCKNEYNLTGVCNKQYCPLANGRYATIKEEAGVLYLNIKTIERAHTPAELWEKIQLPDDLPGALAIINDNLTYWPKRFVTRVKERLVRLHQYLVRYRKYYYAAKPRIVTVNKKFERREQKRELKALVAAKLDTQIKQELLERLKQGTYEFININNKEYMEILREEKRRDFLARKFKSRSTSTPMERSTWDDAEREDFKKARDLEKAGKNAGKEKYDDKEKDNVNLDNNHVEFVAEDDGDVSDIEELPFEDEKIDDLDDIEDIEDDYNEDGAEEEEEEKEKEIEYEYEDGQDSVRADILKRFPSLLEKEEGDDEEMAMLKKKFILTRKRKLMQKQQQENLRTMNSQKKKKVFGAHVEVEYEPSTSSQTTSTSW